MSERMNSQPNFRFIYLTGGFLVFACLMLSIGTLWKTNAGGNTVSGRVFQDYNGNGTYNTAGDATNPAIDTGIANVTVSAFDNAGVLQGTATTAANGTYSINANGTGRYRIEFTNLPAGYYPSARSTDSTDGGTLADAGSTVQFVGNGSTSNVNLAVNRPEEYAQNNPNVATSIFVFGNQVADANNTQRTVVSFGYNSGSNVTGIQTPPGNVYDLPAASSKALANQVGTVFGLAWAKNARRLYAASFFHRHSGFGPGADSTINSTDDAGAIYVINPATNTVVNTLTVPNATTNSHGTTDYDRDNGANGFAAAGKTSLGGMDFSTDEAVLYVMNLENRTLYALNPTTGATIASQAVPTSGVPTAGGTAANCAAGDVRPFAVKYYRSQLYVGMVCSAQSTGLTADLRGYVYTVNPTTLAFSSSPVLTLALNYPRGNTGTGAAEWQPWTDTPPTTAGLISRPSPMLSDIEFDAGGNINIALRDRYGDQIGYDNLSGIITDNNRYAVMSGGDILKACGAIGSWTLESNSRCGGTGTTAQDSGEGPGSGANSPAGSGTVGYGEFFDDSHLLNGAGVHKELALGALAQVAGYRDVIFTTYDPIIINGDGNGNNTNSDGGVRWNRNDNGQFTRGYRLYDGNYRLSANPFFGKGNGLGDVEPLVDIAPIEIGNRVWRDLNGNGVQDANELGVPNVTVHLYDAGNLLIATALTDANGEYYFTSGTAVDPDTSDNIGVVNGQILPATNYQIRLDNPANFTSGGALNGVFLTRYHTATQNGTKVGSDSDGVNITNPTGSPSGTFPVIFATTGAAGDNNHTFDVGFSISAPTAATVSVGGRVVTAEGNGIRNVVVTITDEEGNVSQTRTGSFGYYNFAEVAAGQTVIVSVSAKRFSFRQPAMLLAVNNAVGDLDFVANDDRFAAKP